MKKYIFNDNTKLLFINDDFILVQNGKFKSKEKLNSDFYNKLLLFQKDNKMVTSPSEIFSNTEIRVRTIRGSGCPICNRNNKPTIKK